MKPGRNVRRLHDGSALVARRIGRAFVPKDRPVATVMRCGALYWIGPGLLDLAHQSPAWLVGATCAWCVAAWRAEPEQALAEAEPGGTAPAGPEDLREAVVAQLLEWIGDRPGMHLFELYHRYRNKPGHEHLSDEQIRAALTDHYGIPVRRAVRDPLNVDQPVRAGIHRDDLKPIPSPVEEAPVSEPVAAGVSSAVAS